MAEILNLTIDKIDSLKGLVQESCDATQAWPYILEIFKLLSPGLPHSRTEKAIALGIDLSHRPTLEGLDQLVIDWLMKQPSPDRAELTGYFLQGYWQHRSSVNTEQRTSIQRLIEDPNMPTEPRLILKRALTL